MGNILKLFKDSLLFLILFLISLNLSLAEEDYIKYRVVKHGRVQYDYVLWFEDDGQDLVSGPFIKGIDAFFKGIFDYGGLGYFLHLNLVDSKLKTNLNQAYVKCLGDNFIIKFGQLMVPIGLEQSTDSGHRVFMEPSALNLISNNKYFGFYYRFNDVDQNKYAFSIAFLMPEIGYEFSKRKEPKYSLVVRATINPIKNSDYLNFGVTYKTGITNTREGYPPADNEFTDAPSLISHKAVLSSHASNLPKYYVLGLEWSTILNSFSFQSEFFKVDAHWKDFNPEKYHVWYAQMAYILTGESRVYNRAIGCVCDAIPSSKFGLVEIGFRYCHTDLINTEALLRGASRFDGYKNSFTFGLNWIINRSFKIQLNYAVEKFVFRDEYRIDRDVSGIGMRFQFLI